MEALRQLIIKFLEWIAGIALILFVLGAAITGANQGGFFGFLGGLIAGAVMGTIIFGVLFLLMEINASLKRIDERQEGGGGPSL